MSVDEVTFKNVQDFPDSEALIPRAFPWIFSSGQPYFEWLCGNREVAEQTVAKWMRQPSSEVYIRRVQFLVCGTEIAGGFIGIGGAELAKARMADINSYWASLDVPARSALIEKLSHSAQVFPPVGEDEYYVSKVALDRQFQAKGLAKVMLQHCLDQGIALGYTKFRADIQINNFPSLRCARSLGFQIFYTGESSDGALKYHALKWEAKTKQAS